MGHYFDAEDGSWDGDEYKPIYVVVGSDGRGRTLEEHAKWVHDSRTLESLQKELRVEYPRATVKQDDFGEVHIRLGAYVNEDGRIRLLED